MASSDEVLRRDASTPSPPFSEKTFYLSEFRGRTLALALAAGDARPERLLSTLDELAANPTRVLLLGRGSQRLAELPDTAALDAGPELQAAIWRGFARASRVAVALDPGRSFASACHELALDLGIGKLVWIDSGGGLSRPGGGRRSFVDLGELRALAAAGYPGESRERASLLEAIERALTAGLAAINLCSAEGLGQELFSYAGVGTLFTRQSYVEVRRLGIDDYAAAEALVARGVEEGFLAPRAPSQIDRILGRGFGAFVEGRYLAGIGALLEHDPPRCGEIASLYTLTRFLGEGVGAHLVRHALARASEQGHAWVFACSTSETVARFFERLGFERVSAEALPAAKWRDYDAERRARLICLRRKP